ncbi:MAG: DUF1080 domain-containing protein [Clostridia bacterium]|nr:DUF1080 domain-containing protein [Clostridia bacterium]
MKRLISTVLTLAMLLSMIAAFAVTNVAAATVISNSSPAITADVGETITLSGYSAVFDGDTSATSNITWKNGTSTITSFKPSAKGVTKLTATSGSKSKTIYVVAKEASETEYVLYEADFSKYSNISELKNEGWNFLGASNLHTISGGNYVLGSTSDGYARAILPEWLGDFGDYTITSDLKMLSTTDTGRWVGLVYRIQETNGANYYPYYHMCVRENTVNSGIEFAERTAGNAWNVVRKASGDISSLKSAFNKLKVEAFGKKIRYSINDSQVLFIDESAISTTVDQKTAATYTKGMLGLTMNYGTVAFKNIKITVQESAPVKDPVKLDLVNIAHDELNLINPIANVDRLADVSDIDAENPPASVYRNVSLIDDMTAFLKKCMAKNILPIVYVNSTADNDKLVAAMNASGCKDVTALATNATYLKDLRTKKAIVRTGLIIGNPTSYESIHELRVAVRSAPATLCVIPVSYATKELVSEIQEYAVAVWAAVPSDTSNLELDAITAITAGVNGIISDDASVVSAAINEHFVENAMTRTPIMIGHRGNPTQAPENTLSGFIEAYENGADVFEVDVEITKDGEIIIMHDNTLNRTTTYSGTKTVNQMTLAEVKAEYILAVNNDKSSATTERVPTLKEVCDYFKDKDCKIFVEFKGSNAQNVPATMQLLDSYGMDYLVDVISFSSTFLTQTQTNSPGMSTGYLLSGQDNCSDWEGTLTALNIYLGNAQSVNSTINPAFGCVNSSNGKFTQAATDRGITVWPWTYVYSNLDIGFFSGCDGVTTDDVQWAYNMSKYLEAEDFSLAKGQTYAGGYVTSVAYGNHETVIDIKDTVFSVISGEENVAVVDGKLVALKEGSAEVIFGYVTKTTTGKEYVTYTQPVTVTVEAGSTDMINTLLELAEKVTVADYTSEDIEAIRALYDEVKATDLSTLSADEIDALIVEMSDLLNNYVYETILSVGKEYTSESTAHATYGDVGGVLTNGSKGNRDGGTKGVYAGFSDKNTTVTIDLEEVMDTDTYRAYVCGGAWGISAPKKLVVSVSEDGEAFTPVGATETAVLMNNTDTWDTYEMTIKLGEAVSARYVRFAFTAIGSFVWPDELEVACSNGRPAADNSVYIQSFNTKINSGMSTIFTPDFGEITVDNANHAWTANLLAKWDEEKNAYVVKAVSHGNGAETPSVTLASDEILIVAHKWDIYDTDENPVIGSKLNTENLYGATVGDVVVLEGIDIASKTLSNVAPHVSFVHVHTPGTEATCTSDQICTVCKEILVPAKGHDEGEWTTLEDGTKERRCTECGTLLETVEPEPEGLLGDVNNDGKIDQYDYILVKRHYFETRVLTDDEFTRADVNGDSKVDQYDYILIARHYFGTYTIVQK